MTPQTKKNIALKLLIYSVIFIIQYIVCCFIFWEFLNPLDMFSEIPKMDVFRRSLFLVATIGYISCVYSFADFLYQALKIE